MTKVTETAVFFKSGLVDVQVVVGNSKSSMPCVVSVMKGVPPGCAGLGGVNDGSLTANATNSKSSGVFGLQPRLSPREGRVQGPHTQRKSSPSTARTKKPCSVTREMNIAITTS
jgi:hypothetical protein